MATNPAAAEQAVSPGAASNQPVRGYTLVDWAAQGYLLLIGLLILAFHNDSVPRWAVLVATHFLLVLLIHALIQWDTRGQGSKGLSFARWFYPIFLFAGMYREVGWIDHMFVPGYFDPTIIACEQALFGCQPSIEWMRHLPYMAVSELFYAAYASFYFMIGGIAVALYLRDRQQFWHFLTVVSLLFYACYIIYIFVPVAGPVVLFHSIEGFSSPPVYTGDEFPAAIRRGPFFRLMGWVYEGFESPGGALPSSHVAIAACTLRFSFLYLRKIRFWHLAAAILLCGATVYCHYHYLLDVVTGLATVLVFVPLVEWVYQRWRC